MSVSKKGTPCPNVVNLKISRKDLEKLEVAQLNCNIEPPSKPSEMFDKLYEKRKMLHENVIKRLALNLHEVNMRTEKNIKLCAFELKAHTKEFEKNLRTTLKSIDNLEITNYCASVFYDLQNKAIDFKKQQQTLVNEFYKDLTQFENKRAKDNADLLHVASEEIRKIGYFLPYDVQTFAESEALQMNQLSLNNRRCYEDLRLTLTLITEQTYKSFVDKIFCIRDNWAQQRLQETFYTARNEVEEEFKGYQKFTTRLELKGQELPIRPSDNGVNTTCTDEEWDGNVEKIVALLDTSRRNLIEIHKKTIKAIYDGFSSEIEEIKSGIGIIDSLVIEDRVIKPLIIEVQVNHTKEYEELEAQWQSCLEEIRTHLRQVKDFIKEVAKLWDHHMKRTCESKRLIQWAMEKSEQKTLAIIQDLEVKLNLTLDALRQEHNQSKLEKHYENAMALLNEIKSKYELMYLEDTSIIEDYYKMMNLEAGVLGTDITEFMFETSAVKYTHSFGQYRYLRDVDFGGDSILRDFKMCNQQLQNMRFWRQGVWIALENISGKTVDALKPRAESWVKSKIDVLAEKRTIQLEILSKRFQRIQIEIYERRMKELKEHQEMIEKHKEKILKSFGKSREELQTLLEARTYKINEIEESLTELENNAVPVTIPGVVRGNKLTIERKKAECERETQLEFERFRAYCETRISDNQQVNVNVMKSIKLFHEGGNYSSEEAMSYMNSLEMLDKEIITEMKNIIKDSAKDEHEFIKKINATFNPTIVLLGYLLEEIQFNEDVRQRVQNFTVHIQESAKALKRDFDIFKEHYYCVHNYVQNAPGSKLDVSEDQLWNFLTQLLYKNVTNLLYPLYLPESSAQSTDGEERENMGEYALEIGPSTCCCAGKYSIDLKNPKKFLRTIERADNLSCQDFVGQLFKCELPLKNDEIFMGSMMKYFTSELNSLEREASDFYKKIQGRQIIRGDLIPETYENFIEAALKRFHNYTIQIQQFWLKTLLDFLPMLGQIKSLANEFVVKKINNYQNSAISALKNYEAHFKDCIDFQNCENGIEFNDLDRKLLPLHGYPQNERLLDDLEDVVVEKIANQEVKWDLAFKNFKSQLKCFRVRHIQQKYEIKKIERQYIKLRDTLFVDDLGYNVLEELRNICNQGGHCRKNSNLALDKEQGNDAEVSAPEEMPPEHQLKIDQENLCAVKDYVQKLKQILERERLPTKKQSKYSSPREDRTASKSGSSYQLKLNITMSIVDFGSHSLTTLESIERYIRYLKGFGESQEKFHEEKLFKWLNRWKFNVKKIHKLYRIKCQEGFSILRQVGKGDRPISDEYKKRPDVLEHSKANLQKSKLTEFNNSGQVRFANAALFLTSPRNYHGQIPVLHRRSLTLLRMSPPSTRSASPLKKVLPKEKSSSKVKTITLEPKKKKIGGTSRSPSPTKRAAFSYGPSKSRTSTSPVQGLQKNSEKVKCAESNKQVSPRINSPSKRKSKAAVMSSPKLEYSTKNKRKDTPANGHLNSVILKQASQPSLCMNEKIIQPQEKISVDHLKNEVYAGDHRRLSYEKVHLCIEKSVENLNVAERKRSYLVTYSSDDYKNQEEISLAFLQDLSSTSITTYSTDGDKRKSGERINDSKAAIRTLSGDELILTPSMKLDLEKGETDDIEISDLLHETGETFEDSKVRIPQDDANEYDSEVSTEGELTARHLSVGKSKDLHSGNSLWKSQEADLLNDVDYRQSVYHPAVSRRQKSETMDAEFRPKSKSIEDTFGFASKITKRVTRSRSSTLKSKFPTQCFSRDKTEASPNDRYEKEPNKERASVRSVATLHTQGYSSSSNI